LILCSVIVVGLIAAIAALAPFVNDNLFEGHGIVTASLALAIAVYGVFYVIKGLCSGLGKFNSYGFIVGADGAVRVVVCLILLIAGVTQLGPYALVVVLTPLVGVLTILFTGQLKLDDGPPATWSEITPNLGLLLGGSIFAAALVNAGPITVALLGDTAPAEHVTLFGNAVLITRVPLFLFQAVQAALLPRLTRLAARGDIKEFRSGFNQLVILVFGVGIVGTVGAFAIGPNVLDLVYGGSIDRRTITLLALASGIYMMALAIAQAVIALNGHKHVAIGWSLAFLAYILTVWLVSDDLFLRVELALVSSSVIGLISFATSLRTKLRSLSPTL
jgi:O-antigen/teichoic acid export membrane protein